MEQIDEEKKKSPVEIVKEKVSRLLGTKEPEKTVNEKANETLDKVNEENNNDAIIKKLEEFTLKNSEKGDDMVAEFTIGYKEGQTAAISFIQALITNLNMKLNDFKINNKNAYEEGVISLASIGKAIKEIKEKQDEDIKLYKVVEDALKTFKNAEK